MHSEAVASRFWSKVRRSTSGCWEWPANGCGAKGYGNFSINHRTRSAHRVAWELAFGEIPDGLSVLHRCDNPRCVRPSHLFLGTTADNMADKAQKLRGIHGANNPKAKLTDEAVVQIRSRVANGESQRSVARDVGIGYLAVYRIVHRQTWRHVA